MMLTLIPLTNFVSLFLPHNWLFPSHLWPFSSKQGLVHNFTQRLIVIWKSVHKASLQTVGSRQFRNTYWLWNILRLTDFAIPSLHLRIVDWHSMKYSVILWSVRFFRERLYRLHIRGQFFRLLKCTAGHDSFECLAW